MAQLVDENDLVPLPKVGCEISPFISQQQGQTNNKRPKKIIPKAVPSPAEAYKEKQIIDYLKGLHGLGPASSYGPLLVPHQTAPQHQLVPSQPSPQQQAPRLPPQQPLPNQPQNFSPQATPTRPPVPQQAAPHPRNMCIILLRAISKLLQPAPRGYFYVINGETMQTELKQLPPQFPPDWGSFNLPQVMMPPPAMPPLPAYTATPSSMPRMLPPDAVPAVNLESPAASVPHSSFSLPLTPTTPVSLPPNATLADALSRLQSPPSSVQNQACATSSLAPSTVIATITKTDSDHAEPAAKRRKPSRKAAKIPCIQID